MTFALINMMNMLHIATNSGIKPVVTLYASSLGFSVSEISIIVASYALLPAFLALQIGKWIDLYGTRRLIVIGNGLFLIALWISAVHPTFITFLLQQTMIGIAFTCTMLSLQKRIGSLQGNLDQVVANFTLFGSLGAMIGPILSTFLYEQYGFSFSLYINLFLILVAFIIEFFIPTFDQPKALPTAAPKSTELTGSESIWSLLRERNLRNAILIGGLVLSNRELFAAYFPLLANQLGVSPTMIGVLLSFSGLATIMVRFSQTTLVRVFGRLNVMTWSLYMSGVLYFIMPFTSWIVLLFVFVGILGAGLGIGQPISMAYVLEFSKPERRGEILGLRITVNRVSQLAIPLLFGGIGGLAGVSMVFWASGMLLALFGYITRPLSLKKNRGVRPSL